jgi:hypothetical protein
MGAAATAYLVRRRYALVGYRDPVTSLEIILVLAGVPLAILILLGLLTLRPNFARPPRYRPGQEWNYPPVLWTANPEALREASGQRTGGARGGARGHW